MEISEVAERIYQELLHERAGIWYISDAYGSKIMVKMPSSTIKAAIKGCKVELLFGRDHHAVPNIFHVGIRIYDDPVFYQSVTSTHRFLDEHISLARIMHLEKVQVQIYNELSVCQAFGELTLKDKDKHAVHALQGNPKILYTGTFDNHISSSLDGFQFAIGVRTDFHQSPPEVEILWVEVKIENWGFMENTFVYEANSTHTSIGNKGEGEILEREVLVTLSSLFDPDIYQSPQIPHKSGTRELTDVFAHSDYGIFLIETKALSVISTEERNMERKVVGIQKQIKKGIDQLIGAAKKIAENVPVYDKEYSKINFDRSILPHGIVLVSELLPFGDWQNTIYNILKTMLENKIIIHVFDMAEFMRFVGYSKGDKNMFDYYLLKRNELFVNEPSMFHQPIFVPNSSKVRPT